MTLRSYDLKAVRLSYLTPVSKNLTRCYASQRILNPILMAVGAEAWAVS